MCKQYITGIVFLSVMLIRVNLERSSGLYVDNGFDQTIAHRIVTQKEKREFEQGLLDVLELSNRPKRIARRALLVKRSAPKFLLNVYKNLLPNKENKQLHEEYHTEDFDLSEDIYVIDQSDIIMTFGAHNPHSNNGSKNNRGRRIWFDVTEVPLDEHIITAKLRLYQSTEYGKLEPGKSYTVAIYRVARIKNRERRKYYIDSTNITIGREGWITLNVSQALEHWMKYPKENRGLFLGVYRADSSDRIMRPDDVGIVGVLGNPDKQPFMVSFFKASNIRKTILRKRRSIIRGKSESTSVNDPSFPYIHSATRRKVKACNIQTLYVSFKDLQWQDWIIAPDGYDAYYCNGECNFPLNTHMNATNHAIVQTLVHLLNPGKVPKPCCAPTKLSPISVLYFLDDSNVVLKKYKNMIVNSCGCH